MSAFYCDHHDRIEDSDDVGFNEVADEDNPGSFFTVCDDAYDDMVWDYVDDYFLHADGSV